MVKRLPAVWETWVLSLGWEDPLEKEMATHSSTLAWKIPWTEEPGWVNTIREILRELQLFPENMLKSFSFFLKQSSEQLASEITSQNMQTQSITSLCMRSIGKCFEILQMKIKTVLLQKLKGI